MLSSTHRANVCLYRFLVLVPVLLPFLLASKPEVVVTSTASFPRLYMVAPGEQTHWRSWASYSQMLGPRLRLESHFEYGSINHRFQNPFRIHDLWGSFSIRNHYLKAGRIVHWSGLVQTRVDGGEYTVKTERFGSFKVMGGYPAVTDFSDASFAEKFFFLTSWAKGGRTRNLTLTYWTRTDSRETSSFAGSTWRLRLLSRMTMSGTIAWDISHGKLYYSRLLLTRRAGKHLFRLGARNKRYVVSHPYSWVEGKITVPTTVTLGVTSILAKGRSWWNQFVYRVGDPPVFYGRSTVSLKGYQVTGFAGLQGDRRLLGSGIGAIRKVSRSWTVGGSLMATSTDYRGLMDLQSASGLYGWLSWTPNSMIALKL
ncbi:MAG: hypothetical protein ACE5GH_00705, partial [Fidelibacterota bacterium]